MTHALLSASSAERWLQCTPSARLQTETGTTVYAEEGTLAHSLSELMNRYNLQSLSKIEFNRELKKLKKHELYSDEMLYYITEFCNFVHDRYQASKMVAKDSIVQLEERLDFSNYVPDGFGTGDIVIISDETLDIIDLKYGVKEVSAKNNKQMMLYALGAIDTYEMLYDINTVRMTIYQPRIDNISEWSISVDELKAWAENELKPLAELAFNGEGDFKSGNHCQYCSIKTTCRQRAEDNMELLKHDFQNPDLLTEDEIAEILMKTPTLQKWAKEIEVYALEEAIKGKKWKGFKLVEGRSNRVYVDESKVASALLEIGQGEEDIFNKKLKGVTDMTKLLGKPLFDSTISTYIVKPPGKPTLVPESDRREELNNASADFAEVREMGDFN